MPSSGRTAPNEYTASTRSETKLKGKDRLSEWVKAEVPDSFFKETKDKYVSDVFRDMVQWVQNQAQFTNAAKAEFASVADGWVVAYARANTLAVVTQEVYAPDIKTKVKIPNVCRAFDVPYCDTFEMLKELKERFGAKKRQR